MRDPETPKFRLQLSIAFFFALLTGSAVLIALYTNWQTPSSGTLPDWGDSYYQDYLQYETKYYDRDLTQAEMNNAIDVGYDTVRLVDSDWIQWQRVSRDTGDRILRLAKSIRHKKRVLVEEPINVFPNEYELHYVRDNKLVLKVEIVYETDVESIEILHYEFTVPAEKSSGFPEIRRALQDVTDQGG